MLDRKTLEYVQKSIQLTAEHIDRHYAGNSEQFRLGMKHTYAALLEFLEKQLDVYKTPQR